MLFYDQFINCQNTKILLGEFSFFFVVINTFLISTPTLVSSSFFLLMLCFDLINFNLKSPVFPKNACQLILEMFLIPTSRDKVATFDVMYNQLQGELNDFESIAFYCDFTGLMESKSITKNVQFGVLDFFKITFINDPIIDLMCAEAFEVGLALKKNAFPRKQNTPSPPKPYKKRAETT